MLVQELTSRANLFDVVINGGAQLVLGGIGPQTAARLAERLKAASTTVWNGPGGAFLAVLEGKTLPA